MEAFIENVVIAPSIEALRGGLETTEERSLGPEGPSYSDTGEKAVAQGDVAQGDVAQGFSPEDSPAIAGSPETPQTETLAEKNQWSAWAWLGTCRTREEKNLGPEDPSYTVRIPNIVPV